MTLPTASKDALILCSSGLPVPNLSFPAISTKASRPIVVSPLRLLVQEIVIRTTTSLLVIKIIQFISI